MPKPVKSMIDDAIKMISSVQFSLNNQLKKLQEKDNALFAQIVNNLKNKNKDRAKMQANELAVIRKSIKMVSTSQFALNTITERLVTVSDYGDFVSVISPALAITKSIQKEVSMTTPEANNSLSRVVSDLNDIMVNSGVPDLNYSVQANDEAEKIMNEATKLAEQKTMTKLPQVPANVTEDKEIT